MIKTDRKAVLLRLFLLGVLLAAFLGFAWIMLPERYAPWLLGALVVAWLYFGRSLLRILVTGTAFVLTDRGVRAHIGTVDFVAWDEIESAATGWHGVAAVDLHLRDTEAVLGRLSVLRRTMWRAHLREGGKVSLPASFSQGGAERLLDLVQARIAPMPAEPARRARARGPRAQGVPPPLDTDDEQGEGRGFLTKPFAVMSGIAVAVFAFGVAIALYVYHSRGWELDTARLAIIGLAAFVVALGALPLYTGRAEFEDTTFHRNKQPIGYWLSIVTIVLVGVIIFLGGIGLLK